MGAPATGVRRAAGPDGAMMVPDGEVLVKWPEALFFSPSESYVGAQSGGFADSLLAVVSSFFTSS